MGTVLVIIVDVSRLFDINEGPCPECQLTVHIGEIQCIHCSHYLTQNELAVLERHAKRYQRMMKNAAKLGLAIFIVFVVVSFVVSFIT
jgi:hypothetical protein